MRKGFADLWGTLPPVLPVWLGAVPLAQALQILYLIHPRAEGPMKIGRHFSDGKRPLSRTGPKKHSSPKRSLLPVSRSTEGRTLVVGKEKAQGTHTGQRLHLLSYRPNTGYEHCCCFLDSTEEGLPREAEAAERKAMSSHPSRLHT